MTRTLTVTASLCSALLIGTLMSPAPAMAAECKQWDFGRELTALQGSYHVSFRLQQNGKNLTGSAITYSELSEDGTGSGQVDGFIDGDAIELTAYWAGTLVGKYSGVIGPTGRVEGLTFDTRRPGTKAMWHSKERLSCLVSAEASPSPAKITKRLGKKKKAPLDPQTSGLGEAGKVITTESASGCKPGFVKRQTRTEDEVCVTPEARDRILQENSEGAYYVDPNGAYGPTSCITGYVWRDAYNGDGVCVTPEARETAKQENLNASSNRFGG